MLVYAFEFLSYYGNMTFRLTFFYIRMKASIRTIILCNNNDNNNWHKWLSFIFEEDMYRYCVCII